MISGAMSDGSKQRMVDEDQEDRRRLAQLPVKSSVSLPKGVKSLEVWGDTLIASGKYAKADLSYGELASSSRQEHSSYYSWLLSQKDRDDLTPPIRDLVNYLTMRFDGEDENRVCYPGSTMVRKFKK